MIMDFLRQGQVGLCDEASRHRALVVFFSRSNDWGPVTVVQIFFCAA
jgi:hypothetical protein